MFKKTFFQVIITSLYMAIAASPVLAVDDIIKDNADASGVEKTGTWSTTTSPSNKYAANYNYATSNGSVAVIKFRPAFAQSGEYQLYQWLPQAGSNRTTNASYKIQDADSLDTVTINQQVAGGSWVLIGNYMFSYGSQGYVEINDANNGTYTNADAFKWVYVGPSGVSDLTAPALTAASAQSGEALLSWNAVSGATGYKIFWGTSSGNMPNAIDIPSAGQNAHIVPGLTNGTTYHFKIYAYDAGRQSQDSTIVTAVPANGSFDSHDILVDNPSAEVSGTWSNQTIGNKYAANYSRSTNSSGSGYLRYRPAIVDAGEYDVFYWLPNGSSSRGTNVPFATTHSSGTDTVVINQELPGGIWKWLGRYEFNAGTGGYTQISNVNNGIYTDADAFRYVYAGAGLPAIPQSVEANGGNQAVEVSWNTVEGADGYTLKYGTSPGVYPYEVTTSAVSAVVENLTNDTPYCFAVKSYNSTGESALSDEVFETPNQVNAGSTLIVSDVDYNASGQMTHVTYGNGNVTTHTYNVMQRLTRIQTVNASSQTIQDLNYVYDGAGNILSITDNVNTADQTFQYDHLNRLTQAVGQLYGTKNYSYDAIGNITSKDSLTYTYDNIAGGPHAVTNLSDGTTFTYDDNGNMVTMQKGNDLTEYFYDSENRLTQVKENSQTIESYQYDGDGGRTKKIPNGATPSVKFIGEMYEEQGIRSTAYIFLGDQRIASITNGSILYFHADHLGSANLVTDSTGSLKELTEYEPYGKFSKREKYGDPDEEAWYYFTNQYLDEATDLYYYGARYYSPLIGRFISADTIVAYSSNPQSFNRYSYVHNNPVNLTDPTGNFAFLVFAIAAFKGALIGAAVGAGVAAVTGGDIGRGALFGAIGGAVFGGFSSLAQQTFRLAATGGMGPMTSGGLYAVENVFSGIVAGASAGAAGAAFLGADPLNGAGIGALSGGLFGAISQMSATGWAGVGRVALAGIAGGGIAEIGGGSFTDGFVFASVVAGADFIYRAILASRGVQKGASMHTANKSGAPKQDINGNPIDGGSEVVLHVDLSKNHVGNVSRSLYEKNSKEFWKNFLTGETGPVMNILGRGVPGFQGLGLGHDQLGYLARNNFGGSAWKYLGNFQTMAPIYGINFVGSLINDNPSSIGFYAVNSSD